MKELYCFIALLIGASVNVSLILLVGSLEERKSRQKLEKAKARRSTVKPKNKNRKK